jgi:SAM-dependent methyltransferase
VINQLLARLYRPERGWDPVPPEWAASYADGEWARFDPSVVDLIESRTGSVAGKRVLDLGGGPGQYSAEFARRGADVVWHDVSRRYREIAQARTSEIGVSVRFSLGYLEDAKVFLDQPFDLVFNRICWNYSQDDRRFADLVYALVRPGGAGYVDSHHGVHRSGIRELLYELNARTGWKIGHPPPPPGRIAALLSHRPLESIDTSASTADNDRVLFIRAVTAAGAG